MKMEEWKECKLGDICNISSSKRIFAEEYVSSGIPFYRGKEIIEKHNKNTVSSELFITHERFAEIKSKFPVPQIDDILLTSVGTLGIPWLVNESNFYFKDGNLTWFRSNTEKVNPKFLYYWFESNYAKNQIDSMCIGSTQKALTIDTLSKFSINLPPLPTQQKIARILSSLDDKIELNNKINTNLEQQAGALFKNWFVDFEPFGGKMPEGWKVGKLSDISILSAGGDKPKEVSDKKTEDYKVPIYSNGLDNFGLYGYTNKAKIFEESVTVSARGTIGFVCLRMVPYVPIVRLISLIPKTDFVSAKYLYLHLLNCNITGTGTTQQQLTVPAFSKEQIIIPSKNAIDSFTNTVNPFFETIVHNRKENEKLSSMRDTLLPKLMNGEIKVDEVRK